jgi:hypothetical protein
MQEIECCLSDLEVMQDRAAHEGIKSGLRIAQAISVLDFVTNVWRTTIGDRDFQELNSPRDLKLP